MPESPTISWKLHIEEVAPHIQLRMVQLPGGVYTMGDNQGEYSDEKPEHSVELSSYYLGQFPVTQEIWRFVMKKNPAHFTGLQHPVEQVSWEDISDFLERLNAKLGLTGRLTYRLPTEAEWEYAARAGGRKTYAGSEQLDRVAWYSRNSQRQTHEVGLKAPNEWGLYGMTGNVWEWCADCFRGGYYLECYEKGTVVNPTGPDSGDSRVYRGGSWNGSPVNCRVAFRYFYPPDLRNHNLGFRLARTVWA